MSFGVMDEDKGEEPHAEPYYAKPVHIRTGSSKRVQVVAISKNVEDQETSRSRGNTEINTPDGR